jgi:glycosyltransferase involved in cell wall biosynthesis
MENYIEKALLSIINQKFKDFDIIIVNDNSNDSTEKILEKYQLEDNRIRIINHYKNLGVYCSRIDAALNVIGEYIIFMDPDDMFLNPNLFEELFNYNLKYNLDMVEFSVYHKVEEEKKIFFSIYHEFNHYHNFKKKIIYQPELSNIIFYIPNTKKYAPIICRTLWNKLIRKKILSLYSIN